MFSKLSILSSIDLSKFNFPGFKGNICSDSRKISKGDIFIAFKGDNYDGREFIDDVILKQASIVIYDSSDNFYYKNNTDINVKFISVNNLRQYVGIICSYILGNNLSKVPIIGITGTNGKTSISFFISQILELIGLKASVIGTLGHGSIDNLVFTNETTPDAVDTQNYIHQLLDNNSKIISIEVSSHGLDQFRVNGVNFNTAIFTNLTRDHLDYHKSMDDYAKIKSRLFYWDTLEHAIINIDDEYGMKLYKLLNSSNDKLKIITYGISKYADVKLNNIKFNLNESIIDFTSPWGSFIINISLIGKFNALNIMASLTAVAVLGLGYKLNDIVNALAKIKPVPGRLEKVSDNLKPMVIVDYAHTPDALENTLLTLKEAMSSNIKLWCVFGCGGDKDKGKRSLMGEIAVQYADNVVVTSDNPRFENPEDILKEIVGNNKNILTIVSREDAIKYAIFNANVDDIILIAGKGHENHQIINGEKYFFDDVSCAYNYLNKIRN